MLLLILRPRRIQEWGNGVKFDASDKDDEINLQDWPQVKGMYMPDSIKTFMTGGRRCECTPHPQARSQQESSATKHAKNKMVYFRPASYNTITGKHNK